MENKFLNVVVSSSDLALEEGYIAADSCCTNLVKTSCAAIDVCATE